MVSEEVNQIESEFYLKSTIDIKILMEYLLDYDSITFKDLNKSITQIPFTELK